MSQIFISHVDEDTAIATELAARLESAGYSTWDYKRSEREAGRNYHLEIRDHIDSCAAMIVVISPRSVADYKKMNTEVVRAAELGKEFVPLLAGIDFEEFRRRRPDWDQMLAGANAIAVPPSGPGATIGPIVRGLEKMGIRPDSGAPMPAAGRSTPDVQATSLRLVLLYKRNAHPDEEVLKLLEAELQRQGHLVFVDRHLRTGMEWAAEIKKQVRAADAVIPVLSVASIGSEMLEEEVREAHETAQRTGKPALLPVRVNFEGDLPDPLGTILNPIQYTLWKGREDNARLVTELTESLRHPPAPRPQIKEPAGGAVPLDSEFYIARVTDGHFYEALDRRDSIVLLSGPRQIGKTSLLARGLQRARLAGARVVLTDFQKLGAGDFETPDRFFSGLAELIADQLDSAADVERNWNPRRPPGVNFERFLRREVLAQDPSPLLWGLDEVDRLFACAFANDVFGLFRSWHNERQLRPDGPWRQLTIAIAYATEAHLFITDPNQSPFNVGTKLTLEDFTPEQVAELNRRYQSPLQTADDLQRFFRLLGGNPYFVRRGLQEIRQSRLTMDEFERRADQDDGPFGDHLRRILFLLSKDDVLCDSVRRVLNGDKTIPLDQFLRLRSAGVMAGESSADVRPRCRVYATFLKRHLC
jgi:hypothetical protein